MNLVKCKKCGTTVLTDSTLQDRLIAEKEDLSIEIEKLTKKENYTSGVKLKQLKAKKHIKFLRVQELSSLIKQLRHQIRESDRVVHEVFAELLCDELKNMGYSTEQLREIGEKANEIHSKRVANAKKEIERIYGTTDKVKPHNDWHNADGAYDPTAKKALDSR